MKQTIHLYLGLVGKYLPKCFKVLFVFCENSQFFIEELDRNVILLPGRGYNSSDFYFFSEMSFLVGISLS